MKLLSVKRVQVYWYIVNVYANTFFTQVAEKSSLIKALKDIFPKASQTAASAIDLLLRDPIVSIYRI